MKCRYIGKPSTLGASPLQCRPPYPYYKMNFLVTASLIVGSIMTQCSCNIVGDCSNHIFKQINNSNSSYKIIKFDRECGATTGNSIQLSVIKYYDSLPNEGGNIFISNSKVGGYIEHDTSVQFSWINHAAILIRYDKDLDIYKKDSIVNNIKVIYQLK